MKLASNETRTTFGVVASELSEVAALCKLSIV